MAWKWYYSWIGNYTVAFHVTFCARNNLHFSGWWKIDLWHLHNRMYVVKRWWWFCLKSNCMTAIGRSVKIKKINKKRIRWTIKFIFCSVWLSAVYRTCQKQSRQIELKKTADAKDGWNTSVWWDTKGWCYLLSVLFLVQNLVLRTWSYYSVIKSLIIYKFKKVYR